MTLYITDIDITPQHIVDLVDQDYRQWQCPRAFSELETLRSNLGLRLYTG